MHFKFILTTTLCASIITFAQAQEQPTFGIELDGFSSSVGHISQTNSGIGFSSSDYKQQARLGFGATLLANIPIYERIGLETGLGVTNFRAEFSFDAENTLDIKLNYIKLPIFAAYKLPINSSKSAVHFAIGANIKYLYRSEDNFESLIWVHIGGQSGIDRYNRLTVAPQVNIGYSYEMSDGKTIRIDALAGFDASRFINKNNEIGQYGFYGNLATAKFSYIGVSLKYYFGF